MKLHDLEEFDIVKRRDGKVMIVIYNTVYDCLALFSPETCGCSGKLRDYRDDMTVKGHLDKSDKDIVAVYKCDDKCKYTLLSKYFKYDCRVFPWTWEREEVKEMTIAELEAVVGCKIKIIKEDNE